MTTLTDLAETLAVLARPGVRVDADGDHLVITLVNRDRPPHDLVTFLVTPLDRQWPDDFADIVKSFDEFNDIATEIVSRATDLDMAIALSQDIYNKGVVLNSHGWYDVLRFTFDDVELDIGKWTAR
jgi:hypothetical protein